MPRASWRPGTGKSELARQVAGHLSIAVLSVDPIEAPMLRAGIAQSFETGLAAYLVVEAIAGAQLALGQSVIVDAVETCEANTTRVLAWLAVTGL
jgi:predicted kinase